MTLARMMSVLGNRALLCDRSEARVEVPGPRTSIDDMKLGVRFVKKCWKLYQYISWQTRVPFSTDCLFRRVSWRLFIRVI